VTSRYKIDEIGELVHPRDGQRKIVNMLVAYLDESGVHGNADLCVVAGYFGGISPWRRFEREWKRILARAEIKDFHANRFWARSKGKTVGVYSGWTEARKREFIADLVEAIASSRIYPVA
jgi:hypothetical protein